MNDPTRILDETGGDRRGSAGALRRSMLRAARGEASPPGAQGDLLAALGLGDHAVVASSPPVRGGGEAEVEWWVHPPLFAAVLGGEKSSPRRFATGALFSTMAHAAALALAIHGMSGAPAARPDAAQAMVQLSARPQLPAEPLAPGTAKAPLGEPSPVLDPEALTGPIDRGDRVAARAIEGSRAGDPAVRISSPDESAVAADSLLPPPRAVAGAGVDRAADPGKTGAAAVEAARPSSEILPFGEGMRLPRLIDGPEPVYPRAAREARVEGALLAKCVITTGGALRSCRVLRSLPFLDEPVLAALAQRRYEPVMFQGRPVNVEYVITFRFELP